MLTPLDLKNKNFSKGFRGYDVAEVDAFMAELRKEYERLYLDNLELKESVERVSSKLEYYQQMESTMQSTLMVAQETAAEVKANSEKKAAVLEQETQAKCDQLLENARAAAQKLTDEAALKTENLYAATEAVCRRQQEETKNLTNKLRREAETETSALKITTQDECQKRTHDAAAQAAETLENARAEANKIILEANTDYRKIVGDAEERSRKIIFDAESRASMAQAVYEDQVKKAMVHRRHMLNLLETQLELVKNFDDQAVK